LTKSQKRKERRKRQKLRKMNEQNSNSATSNDHSKNSPTEQVQKEILKAKTEKLVKENKPESLVTNDRNNVEENKELTEGWGATETKKNKREEPIKAAKESKKLKKEIVEEIHTVNKEPKKEAKIDNWGVEESNNDTLEEEKHESWKTTEEKKIPQKPSKKTKKNQKKKEKYDAPEIKFEEIFQPIKETKLPVEFESVEPKKFEYEKILKSPEKEENEFQLANGWKEETKLSNNKSLAQKDTKQEYSQITRPKNPGYSKKEVIFYFKIIAGNFNWQKDSTH